MLFALAGGLFLYDCDQHNYNFARTSTGRFLERHGALPYAQTAWAKTMGPAARAVLWSEEHVPTYARDYAAAVQPYVKVAVESARVGWVHVQRGAAAACDCFHQKAPVVVAFVSALCRCVWNFDSNIFRFDIAQIEQYVPGLPQKIGDASVQLWTNVRSTSIVWFANGEEFIRTKVFV